MKIGILISNPFHHYELTEGVARKMNSKGHQVKYISICRLRRLPDPVEKIASLGLPLSILPLQLKIIRPSSGAKVLGSSNSLKRKILHWLVWQLLLRRFIKKETEELDILLLMNDVANPYDSIISSTSKGKLKTVLLQEGIRFDLPNEEDATIYGSNADYVLSWGEKSSKLFMARRKYPYNTVYITGSPRFDKQRRKYQDYPVNSSVLGVFTNPIDDQGYLSTDLKHSLVVKLINKLTDNARENGIHIILKPHPREDAERYQKELKQYDVEVLRCSIDEAIKQVGAGIVFGSTVGLELLAANRPIGQCKIPDYGYVFDYVSSGAAFPIDLEKAFTMDNIFTRPAQPKYLTSHLREGDSCERICEIIEEIEKAN